MRFEIKGLEERIAPSRGSFHRFFSRIHDFVWSAQGTAENASGSGNHSFEHRQELTVTGDGTATVVHNSGEGVIVTDASGPAPVVVSNGNQQVVVSANSGCVVRIQNDGNGFQSVVVTSE